jgi:peroxiredoxin family protein
MAHEHPDKLSVIVFSGDYDRVHYAFVMASAAAAVNTAVTLFFSMDACHALTPEGWKALPASEGRKGADVDADYAAKNVAQLEILIEACVAFDVRFIVCEMALRAKGLAFEDLRTDMPLESGGVVTFLTDASKDGAMVFI